jgi:hypothetical protein
MYEKGRHLANALFGAGAFAAIVVGVAIEVFQVKLIVHKGQLLRVCHGDKTIDLLSLRP